MKVVGILVVVGLYFVLVPLLVRMIERTSMATKTKRALRVVAESAYITASLIYILGFSVGLLLICCAACAWNIKSARSKSA